MRKIDRCIEDPAAQARIIHDSHHMVLGMVDQGKPYAVPLNFGYEAGKIYFHCAREGRKIDILRQSGGKLPVCGVLVGHAALLAQGEMACQLSTRYASVMFEGVAEEITDAQERLRGMKAILKHHQQEHRVLPAENLGSICLIGITIQTLSAKGNDPASV